MEEKSLKEGGKTNKMEGKGKEAKRKEGKERKRSCYRGMERAKQVLFTARFVGKRKKECFSLPFLNHPPCWHQIYLQILKTHIKFTLISVQVFC